MRKKGQVSVDELSPLGKLAKAVQDSGGNSVFTEYKLQLADAEFGRKVLALAGNLSATVSSPTTVSSDHNKKKKGVAKKKKLDPKEVASIRLGLLLSTAAGGAKQKRGEVDAMHKLGITDNVRAGYIIAAHLVRAKGNNRAKFMQALQEHGIEVDYAELVKAYKALGEEATVAKLKAQAEA